MRPASGGEVQAQYPTPLLIRARTKTDPDPYYWFLANMEVQEDSLNAKYCSTVKIIDPSFINSILRSSRLLVYFKLPK